MPEGSGPRRPAGPLAGARRRAITGGARELVGFDAIDRWALPVVARPLVAGVDLAEWTRSHHDELGSRLRTGGAVLFRGFSVAGAEGLEAL